MAILRMPILGPDMRIIAGATDQVQIMPAKTGSGTPWGESNNDELILAFANTSTKDGISGSFEVPDDYSASSTDPDIIIPWTIPGTSTNNVVWDFDYNAIAVGEDIDPTSFTESVTVTDAGPGTADLLQRASISLARTGIAALDIIRFTFSRDGTDSADTLAASVYVWMDNVMFRYADA